MTGRAFSSVAVEVAESSGVAIEQCQCFNVMSPSGLLHPVPDGMGHACKKAPIEAISLQLEETFHV